MPPQQCLRNCAGRVWPKYRYVAWAAVGLKGFGRRQVAFVGPPEAVSFCELPALFYLHFPSHRLQSTSASRFKFVRLLGGAATCGKVVSDLGSSRVTDFRKVGVAPRRRRGRSSYLSCPRRAFQPGCCGDPVERASSRFRRERSERRRTLSSRPTSTSSTPLACYPCGRP